MPEALQRVMIIGQPGAGKSTLARNLGDILQLPVVHIDRIHWQSGWIERTADEKHKLCSEVHTQQQWIFEGGHSRTWPERLERAEMLVWLDFPLHTRGWRVVLRTLRHYGKSRPDLPEGCPEHFNIEFFQWIWDTRKTGRIRMQCFFENAPLSKRKYRLRNRREVDGWLDTMAADGDTFGFT